MNNPTNDRNPIFRPYDPYKNESVFCSVNLQVIVYPIKIAAGRNMYVQFFSKYLLSKNIIKNSPKKIKMKLLTKVVGLFKNGVTDISVNGKIK